MPRVCVVHWNSAEAKPLLDVCRQSGFDIEYPDSDGMAVCRAIRVHPPEVIVIDLSRRPSHGREVAIWLRSTKSTRHIPIVFAGGEPEKVARVREILPDAAFTEMPGMAAALKGALRRKPADPVRPRQMMERAHWKSAAQKLGIAAGSSIAVVEPPRDFPSLPGELPDAVDFVDDPDIAAPMTLWFVHELHELQASLRRLRALAGRSKLWILWRKGSKNGLTQISIATATAEMALVACKVRSVDDRWSAMLYARRKA